MSASFEIPEWLTSPDPPQAPPDTPGIPDRLNTLRDAMLDAAGGDSTRAVLAPWIDAHLDDASDGIDCHVTRNGTS